MAELVAELFGESVRKALSDLWGAFCAASEEVVEWFREVATPPPGLKLATEDGSTFTGLVLLERNLVIAVLAVRHPARALKKNHESRRPFDGFPEQPQRWAPGPLGDY